MDYTPGEKRTSSILLENISARKVDLEEMQSTQIEILDAFLPSQIGAYLVKKQTKSYSELLCHPSSHSK